MCRGRGICRVMETRPNQICYSGREYIEMNLNKHEKSVSLEQLSELYHRNV